MNRGETMSVILNDVFGRLTWDNHYGCWRGSIDWPLDRQIEVALCQPGNDVAAGLRMACAGLDWLKSQEEEARRFVAGELVHVYNVAWREEAVPINEEEFSGRIELVRIIFEEDGALLLTYDPGEMFGGQYIDSEFGSDGSFRGARLAD